MSSFVVNDGLTKLGIGTLILGGSDCYPGCAAICPGTLSAPHALTDVDGAASMGTADDINIAVDDLAVDDLGSTDTTKEDAPPD